ncbi:MFS transporter [Gilvimarinus agarilyticus]|uniref:MFS transporter n=1 Tax=Gilvimarinus agarilyticus TaxID=679259 RepID=UPI0005A098BA|nr:MFS transporter [Gilvimarinus agarilyticus]
MKSSSLTQALYRKLLNEEDARVCKSIAPEACHEVPGNFLRLIFTHFLSKLGDACANPKIVLPWLLESLAAPAYLLGFLVPIRESGSLLPQLVLASYVRRLPIRKYAWSLGALLQGVCVLAMAAVAMLLEGAAAGFSIVGLLVVFSLARGLSSVAAKDVLGKTIPKKRRGRVNGWSASAAGLVTVVLAVVLIMQQGSDNELKSATLLLILAGGLWLLAAFWFLRVKEYAGEVSGGGNALTEAIKRLNILINDAPFRRFVIARALLLCSALTAPYYVALGQQHLSGQSALLGYFILASGLASLLSAPFWGRFADVSSRRVMIWAAIISAGLGVVVFLLDVFEVGLAQLFMLPLLYFLLTVAHQGVRVGRKTYVVDLAEGNRRTDYVAVSNSVIGLVLLLMGASGVLASNLGYGAAILALSMAGVAGAFMAYRLPEVG